MKKLILFFSFLITVSFCFAEDYFFVRTGKGMSEIADVNRKLCYFTCFVTDYNDDDMSLLDEIVMKAVYEVYANGVGKTLKNLKGEIVDFMVSGKEQPVAGMRLFYNADINYYSASMHLYDKDGKQIDEIEITRDEYNEIGDKCWTGERFDIIKQYNKLKKKGTKK